MLPFLSRVGFSRPVARRLLSKLCTRKTGDFHEDYIGRLLKNRTEAGFEPVTFARTGFVEYDLLSLTGAAVILEYIYISGGTPKKRMAVVKTCLSWCDDQRVSPHPNQRCRRGPAVNTCTSGIIEAISWLHVLWFGRTHHVNRCTHHPSPGQNRRTIVRVGPSQLKYLTPTACTPLRRDLLQQQGRVTCLLEPSSRVLCYSSKNVQG